MSGSRPLEERIHIVLAHAKFDNYEEVRRQWKNHFPTDAPHRDTMAAVIAKLKDTRSVQDRPHSGRQPSVTLPEQLQEVQELVKEMPQTSTRRASLSL